MTQTTKAIGLMSGTSLDGVDAAWIETDGVTVAATGPTLTRPYPENLRELLRSVLGERGDVAGAEREMTLFHVRTVEDLMAQSGRPDLIGFHGHTIHHAPQEGRTRQIGDGALLAAHTGVDVVGDFRSADVASGGQGAPLVPVFHQALSADLDKPLAVLNIGGVANVTWIGRDGALSAFDTGPGNALIDDWALRHTGRPCDLDGRLARDGAVNAPALARLLDHPYFAKPAPKSLDRDAFDPSPVRDLSPEDGAATLTAFTCAAIALARFPEAPKRWLVCGGGRRNPCLMAGLTERLSAPVMAVEAVGWDGDALEAQAFGFLAVRALKGLPLTFPDTTGCPGPICGGAVYLASGLRSR